MKPSCYSYTVNIKTLAFLNFVILCFSVVSSFEYEVGGKIGWAVPPRNDTGIYNTWASKNRFKVGDTLRFKFKKDSVMQVTEEEYKDCYSTHPSFFSSDGNTVYKLDRWGPFYFISGVTGHCPKGQKMIIKVISESEDENDSSAGNSDGGQKKNAASHFFAFLSVPQLIVMQVLVFTSMFLLA